LTCVAPGCTLECMATAPISPAPASPPRWTLQPLPAATPEDHAGQLFAGRYMMRRRIGGGGMSTIHEAMDTNLGIRVAVKIMRGDLPSDPVDRFRREALVLAGLAHEHIARILDRQDPEAGPRFLVTEYIDGVDLSVLRRRGPVPAAVVHSIGLQVSAALAYAHEAGVLHRDINPSNLMLVRHPSGDIFAKVIDFGIAKLEQGSNIAAPENAPAGARRATRGDVVLGTIPYYCGHEGPRRDVHALALTLAELLTGQTPDPAADLAGIPPALARVLTTALRSDELATMDALHAALREADEQAPAEAEAERRRFAAQLFDKPPSAPKQPPTPDEAPRFAGRYILCGDLGQGGMGRVQIAFDTQTRRRVALKTIHPRNAGIVNLEHRFRREARALAAIERGAPHLFDFGADPEPFFTMEIVDGVTLAATLKHGKIEPQRALGLAIDLAEILHAAHEVGVVHRDVKPDNIVIGHCDRVRLLDFGACLLLPRFHRRHLVFPATPADERYATGALEAVGTFGYTAPEVLAMDGGAGPRSDIYSVCAVLYEMLTGRPLVDRATTRTLDIEPGEFAAALGPVADLLRRGTAREPADRVSSMADLARSLEILRAGLVGAQQRRQRVWVAGVAAACTAVLAGLLMLARRSPAPPTTSTPDAPGVPITLPGVSGMFADTPALPADTPAAPADTPSADALPPATPTPSTATLPAEDAVAPKPPANAVAAGDVPVDPQPELDTSMPSPTGRPVVALTEAVVAARLTTRADQLRARCDVPWLVLDLTIQRGRATLAAINGMPFTEQDPLHACVRTQLRGLDFPRADKPAKFSLPIDLSLKDPR
jgi:serine/threonine protein kinase